jgi:DNA-binding MarR family transcriptional regulator
MDGSAGVSSDEEELDPRNSLGYRTGVIFRAFNGAVERRAAPFGVSAGQWRFLRQLWIGDGITQAALSARAGTRQPTTARAVNSLVRSGFVERIPSDTDRRKVYVRLTDKGRALRHQLLPVILGINDIATQNISPEFMMIFLEVLDAVTENLRRDGALSWSEREP